MSAVRPLREAFAAFRRALEARDADAAAVAMRADVEQGMEIIARSL